ncbi:MAG TPA: asparagine synthase (glutamine-hydrolyzing), partial [Sphingobacteriaceae bacterium]
MCGIFGSFSFNQTKSNYRNSLNAIEHRGPDDEGFWRDDVNGVLLTHKRLSVVDLSSSGHQPMFSLSDRYIIVFNGEIYNHLEIRRELEVSGFSAHWRGHSDTETLLAGFDRWGIIETVNKAVGMFAFAVWDKQSKNLTICRDRLGEKPLYYSFMDNTFLFGSDLASFKVHDNFKGHIDRDALALFMRHSYIPAPYTIYKNTYKLLPGTFLTISQQNRELNPIKYWSLDDVIKKGISIPFKSADEAVIELEALLLKSVNQQMLATDVPLGAFLSGGIDSSLIVSLMQAQSTKPIKTFTIGFNDIKFNEAVYS